MKRVELLAPAGGYETMVGAFNAGADAVYLGGAKFGARAYADNFDTQQVLDAISYAHLFGKKIYMTVNTLVKEREYGELYDFMLPFAEKKLDGVIVQDLGVMKLIRDEFPDIELHASTQATVTGVNGAKLLKDLGCVRVVPARELSLMEMREIREKADVEVEAFIHGAMCYCYSGMCLFSSMVGTRSGNRGRCAQPCRLPYYLAGSQSKEQYPLSLKDMCTVSIIPELIEAGIDSFKIEGRMKRPEYAAGVTSIYRKYIDLYYKDPAAHHEISKEDMDILNSLYLRSQISQGYYHKHNGKDMVTLDSPSYNGTSDKVLSDVKEKYLDKELKLKCKLKCRLCVGEEASLTMALVHGEREIALETHGNKVQEASKRPMDKENVLKQISKFGGTVFEPERIDIDIDDRGSGKGIFIPVSELNELRRNLCDQMIACITEPNNDSDIGQVMEECAVELGRKTQTLADHKPCLHVLVNTTQQLKSVLEVQRKKHAISRIYIDSNLFLGSDGSFDGEGAELFVALPYMTRHESFDGTLDIEKIADSAIEKGVSGLLVRNLEQLGILKFRGYTGNIVLDYGMYIWNEQAAAMVKDLVSEVSVPLELTIHEAAEVTDKVRKNLGIPVSFNVYGYAPMMVSAGCIKKTLDRCSGNQGKILASQTAIVDRMGNELKVTTNCRNCYNVIWNALPTSLHKKIENIAGRFSFDNYRVDLTIEDGTASLKVLNGYTDFILNGVMGELNDLIFTTGHFKRGVE
ncbi:putative protease [Butyrivibrio proteoclasticus]|uniref:Putative protease n=1 Tax=Butyrivibrio proteoclasticus TaxID=43305 RepID=A0A1I5UEP5_9FIRM|nr:U32 family peptidase [Butyrivibrio proteoclasticus]SFP93096.1 putative protease [Butyrivibrio proteoclasticus]